MTTTTTAFAALGDDTRWGILSRLGDGAASASALAAEFPISRQAIVKHLEILRRAGLVETDRHGRELRYQPIGAALSALGRDLERIGRLWDQRLAAIKAIAESAD